jgi:ferredoxin
MPHRLRVDWISCEGRGLCIEMLPELVDGDDWGYPIIDDVVMPGSLEARARRTVAACPTLALRLDGA